MQPAIKSVFFIYFDQKTYTQKQKIRVNNFFFNLDTTKFRHYHLQLLANPKEMAQKNDSIFSIYGNNGIIR